MACKVSGYGRQRLILAFKGSVLAPKVSGNGIQRLILAHKFSGLTLKGWIQACKVLGYDRQGLILAYKVSGLTPKSWIREFKGSGLTFNFHDNYINAFDFIYKQNSIKWIVMSFWRINGLYTMRHWEVIETIETLLSIKYVL